MRERERANDDQEERRKLRKRAVDANVVHGADDHMRGEEVQHPYADIEHGRPPDERKAMLLLAHPVSHDASPALSRSPPAARSFSQYRGEGGTWRITHFE